VSIDNLQEIAGKAGSQLLRGPAEDPVLPVLRENCVRYQILNKVDEKQRISASALIYAFGESDWKLIARKSQIKELLNIGQTQQLDWYFRAQTSSLQVLPQGV
jgi:hypothetical protein